MYQMGVVKPGEICPGLTWEEHADSLTNFLLHDSNGTTDREVFKRVLVEVVLDGDPLEVKDKYAKLERNS